MYGLNDNSDTELFRYASESRIVVLYRGRRNKKNFVKSYRIRNEIEIFKFSRTARRNNTAAA